jgi:hypothetical protein
MRRAVGALVALGLVVGLLGTAVVGSAMAMFGIDVQPTATSAATSKIPAAMLALYRAAAATCPGLPWTILAAIGTVESDNGQSNLPGVHSGANSAGAEGPMQFESATFARRHMRPSPPTRGLVMLRTARCVLRGHSWDWGLSHSGGTLRRAAVLTSSHFPHTCMAGY